MTEQNKSSDTLLDYYKGKREACEDTLDYYSGYVHGYLPKHFEQ